MKKKFATSLLALSGITLFSLAHADGVEGAYGGASVGYAHDGSDHPLAPTDRNDTSFKLYGGYGFTPNFSVEYGYTDLGKFNTANGSLKARGLFADAVGTWPLSARLSAIGRVGLFNASLKDEDSVNGDSKDRGTSVKLGGGLQYALSKTTDLRGEWEHYKLNTSVGKPDVDTYSVGVQFHF
ncbi:MAG: outer membrane beta-barrel protein [Burkholderiaceae bacterium]